MNSVKSVSEENNKKNKSKSNLIKDIQDNVSHEVFIALTGQIGSGCSLATQVLTDLLKEHKYEVSVIKISKILEESIAELVKIDVPNNNKANKAARITTLQNIGDKVREDYDETILAQVVITHIKNFREELIDKGSKKKHLRIAYVIDSLKHPKEVELLKSVYQESFYLFGLHTPLDTCKSRMISHKFIDESTFNNISTRDLSDEGNKSGQQVIKTLQLADIFIRNATEGRDHLRKKIERYINLILGAKIVTPTIDETSMYFAYAAAARSACLSRQVGAVITSLEGDILATGCNDVPKAGGGLYNSDHESDNRCFKFGEKCFNDERKSLMYDEIIQDFSSFFPRTSIDPEQFRSFLSKTKIKQLIEFSRAVHAEMNAIINLAKNNEKASENTILYCTTYPCHSCARHIVAAGIKKVYYVEPYTKSLVTHLHSDSVSTDENSEDSKVKFLPYEGVTPKKYNILFYETRVRKNEKGQVLSHRKNSSMPRKSLFTKKFYEFEDIVVKSFYEESGMM